MKMSFKSENNYRLGGENSTKLWISKRRARCSSNESKKTENNENKILSKFMGGDCDKSKKTRLALFASKSDFSETFQWSQISSISQSSHSANFTQSKSRCGNYSIECITGKPRLKLLRNSNSSGAHNWITQMQWQKNRTRTDTIVRL